MKDYKQLLKELPSKTVVLACGKFNPPNVGHELVVKAVKKLAEQKGADHVIYASNASDAKKNPLLIEKKLQYLNMVFPKTNFVESADNIADVIKQLKENYKNIVVVTSSDKAAAIRRLGVEVIAAGEKDPDSDDTIRSAAAKGLYEEFKKGLPSAVRELDSRRMMNDVRVGTGLEVLKESINLVKDDLREKYFRGEIFKVGEIVESNKVRYEIVKRGSNHLLLKEESGTLVSKWIQDVKQIGETMKLAESYTEAEAHKVQATQAKMSGNMGAFHAHMANHHDSLADWHGSKGRHSSADHHAAKAEEHHEESLKHTYQAEEKSQIETEKCPQCGKVHEGVCPEDFKQPFDPMFKESFKEWRTK